MPQLTGLELLARVHRLHPAAKRVVLVDWFDRRAGEPLRRALAFGQIDDLLSKPLISGDEHSHQGVSNFLYAWARQHGPGPEAVRVIGPQCDPGARGACRVRGVLRRRRVRSASPDRRAGIRRRRCPLRRAGRGAPGQIRRPGDASGAWRHARRHHVGLIDPRHHRRTEHHGPLPHRGRRRGRPRPADPPRAAPPAVRRHRNRPGGRPVHQ